MKKKRGMQARYQKSYDSKDEGGSSADVMNWSLVKEGVKFYKAKEGINKLIIVPYIVKTKNHPLVYSGDMEVGDKDYMMDLWAHRNVGPTEKDAVCLKNNYGKACPVCDQAKEYRQKGDEDSFKALRASRRAYYNVLNARRMNVGLMIFSVSHFLFEKEMIEEARSMSKGGEIIDFASAEDGAIVKFRGAMTSIGKTEFLKFKSFGFLEREEDLWDGIEEETVSFDEIMILRDAKELEKLLYDEDEEKEDEDEKPVRKKPFSKKKKNDEDEEDEDEEDEDEEDEDEPKPKKSSGKKSGSGKNKKTPCPHGYVFGDDCDTKDECDDCDSWEECSGA